MDKHEITNLSDRIDRLETENLWLKRIGGLLVIAMGTLIVGQGVLRKTQTEVVSRRVAIQDPQGRERVRLGVDALGQPYLTLLDDRGNTQVDLRSEPDRSSVLQFRHRDKPRMALRASSNGHVSLNLLTSKQESGASLYVQPDSEAALCMNRGLGGVLFGVDNRGEARLLASDTHGQPSSALIDRLITRADAPPSNRDDDPGPKPVRTFSTTPASDSLLETVRPGGYPLGRAALLP